MLACHQSWDQTQLPLVHSLVPEGSEQCQPVRYSGGEAHSTLTTRSGIVHGCLSRDTVRTAKIRAGYRMAGIRCTQTTDALSRKVSRGPRS